MVSSKAFALILVSLILLSAPAVAGETDDAAEAMAPDVEDGAEGSGGCAVVVLNPLSVRPGCIPYIYYTGGPLDG